MSLLIDGATYSILDVCRLCLGKETEFVNVFTGPPESDETNAVSLIRLLGNVPITEDDGLPPQICLQCQENLTLFYKFRLEIEHNYELLQLYIKNASFFTSHCNTTELKTESSDVKYEDDDDHYLVEVKESAEDEESKPLKQKNKKKKTKKTNSKKKQKKIDSKETKKVTKTSKVISNEGKSHDKLSAALQKRLENRDKCPLCFEKLQENVTMAEHFYTHYSNSNLTPLIVNGKKTTVCNICNKSYKFNSMIPHHRKHLKLYPFKCEIEGCNKAFASTMNLGWHLDNHNGVKKYQCQTCGKTFHLSGSLRNHEETHIIERAQCKICLKTYKNHIMLKLHMKRHIYGQRHKCEEPGCDKAFYSAQELRKHAHVHYGSKTFICDVCSKPWYTEKDLIRHKKYHDPVKQHQCSECMKTFVDKSQLRCHEMTHRGERPHVCEYCNTGFITKSKLKRHQVKSCKGMKQYQIL